MASTDTNTIDATPISPVRSNERRNSLEKHLQHRPEAQDLKNRHILLDTTTAPYALSRLTCGRQMSCAYVMPRALLADNS